MTELEHDRKELTDLQHLGSWDIFSSRNLSKEGNILRGYFFHTIRNADTAYRTYKARFVARRHKDFEKYAHSDFHNCDTCLDPHIGSSNRTGRLPYLDI